jgi:protein-S-isoprenylcysteine O-methyltransferase Ste14
MSEMVSKQTTDGPAALDGAGRKRMVEVVVWMLILDAVLIAAAGRLDWVRGWLYVGAYFVIWMMFAIPLMWRNPELANARGRKQEGTKRWDKIWGAFFLPMPFLQMAVAGLDGGRYGWSSMPFAWSIAAIALLVPTVGLAFWAMNANTHFEKTVRIQEDRGHQVVTDGPYRFVRHPGYVGIILLYALIPLVLGSWWALIVSGLTAALFVIRTALEDRTLQAELPGYAEYAHRTRFRLLPGIW